MTVLEVIQRSTEFLAKKGVESPRLQVEWLLEHALGMPRLKLYLNFERVLNETEMGVIREMVKRRGNREPLQHIIGSTSFCGYEIKAGPRALIPRPETEILAERGWIFLNELSGPGKPGPVALDFGTGSGCLAIALALKAPAARVEALDISADSLQLARENAERHPVQDRIEFIQSEGFRSLPSGQRYDLIISNPPYIPTAEIEELAPEVREHDPRQALDGGPDGLDCFRYLAENARGRLKPGGKIMLEFGDDQGEPIRALFKPDWLVEGVETDYTGRPRFLVARLVTA